MTGSDESGSDGTLGPAALGSMAPPRARHRHAGGAVRPRRAGRRRHRIPRRHRVCRGRHHLPATGLLGADRTPHPQHPLGQGLGQRPALLVPGHPRASGDQATAGHRRLAAERAQSGGPPARAGRRGPVGDHPDERRGDDLRVRHRGRGHRHHARRPGRLRHRHRAGALGGCRHAGPLPAGRTSTARSCCPRASPTSSPRGGPARPADRLAGPRLQGRQGSAYPWRDDYASSSAADRSRCPGFPRPPPGSTTAGCGHHAGRHRCRQPGRTDSGGRAGGDPHQGLELPPALSGTRPRPSCAAWLRRTRRSRP